MSSTKDLKSGIPLEVNLALEEVFSIDGLLSEGIDVSPVVNKATGDIEAVDVSYNPNHNKGLSTTKNSQPTSFKLDLSDLKLSQDFIQVFSILQRTKMDVEVGSNDGTPLVYAFKNERGYRFKAAEDKKQVEDIMDAVLLKFIKKYSQEISSKTATVVLPSGNALNSRFASRFKELAEQNGLKVNLYTKIFQKLTVEEVIDVVINDIHSQFNRWIVSLPQNVARTKRFRLDRYFDEMVKQHNGEFSYHYIKDPEIRHRISNAMKLTGGAFKGDFKEINECDVLMLDDTISAGTSLKDACKLVCETYHPRSLLALTMFSRLA